MTMGRMSPIVRLCNYFIDTGGSNEMEWDSVLGLISSQQYSRYDMSAISSGGVMLSCDVRCTVRIKPYLVITH